MTDLPNVCSPTSETRPAHGNPWPGAASDSLRSTVETLGIVSASNEAGRHLSPMENDRRDESLRRDLAPYQLHQVQGRFGRVEKPLLSMVNPFVVVNVAKETVVALGAKYHQFHVIFGAREGGGEHLALRFELVEADWAARVLAVRKLFVHANQQRLYLGAGCPDDRGRFFVLPGFDENAANPDLETDLGYRYVRVCYSRSRAARGCRDRPAQPLDFAPGRVGLRVRLRHRPLPGPHGGSVWGA